MSDEQTAWNSTLKPGKGFKQRTGFKPRKKESKPRPRTAFKTKRKVTGERELFIEMYKECGKVCALSGADLLPPEHPMFHHQFSHILPKGSYGRWRLRKENIVPCLKQFHDQWEAIKDKERLAVVQPLWKPWCDIYYSLRYQYNTTDHDAPVLD